MVNLSWLQRYDTHFLLKFYINSMQALHERTRVLKNAPHLSRALPLVLPVKR